MFKTYIELNTGSDVDEFLDICRTIPEEVTVKGLDEHGREWSLSAKSFLNAIVMKEIIRRQSQDIINRVDWNTIYVECERDIYALIAKFAK